MPIRYLDDGDFEFYYPVEYNNGKWSCGCYDFNKPGHKAGYHCKHIKEIVKQFKLENKKLIEETFDEKTIPF